MESYTRYRNKTFNNFGDAFVYAIDTDIVKPIENSKYFVKKAMNAYLDRVAKEVTGRFTPWSPKNRGQQEYMQNRTGKTKRAIQNSVEVKLDGTKSDMDSTVTGYIGGPEHLIVNEYGGNEYPKSSRHIYVPLEAALSSQGVPLRRNPKDWPNTYITRTKRGHYMMWQRRIGGVVPLYVLVDKVYIKARLGMRKSIENNWGYFEEKVLNDIARSFK